MAPRLRVLSLAVVLGGALWAGSASADPIADFYRGKTVEILIGYSPGGGYDTYARVLARNIGRHIPGNPTVVPKNLPGAGSLKAMNYIYALAPKDGTSFGTVGRGIALEPLLHGEGTRFDALKMSWIGSVTNEVSVCVSWKTSPVKTWADLQSKELIVGGTGSGSDTDTFPKVLKNVLGAKLKLITGYPGGSDVLLAMERGEVGGRCGWSWSSVTATRPNWLKDGSINILMQIALAKHPDLPNVPIVMDLATQETQRAALKLIFSQQAMARPFVAPPDLPADRLQALRSAFDETMRDPEFLAEAEKAQLEVIPISGEAIHDLLVEVYKSPKDAIDLAITAMKP